MANGIETKVERVVDKDQWYDPCLLMAGNGNEDWARWATKWLYAGVVDFQSEKDSQNWPKYGIITQFDRALPFALAAAPAAVPSVIPTNNRNWLLLSRVATATDSFGNNVNLANINVSITVPTTTFLVDNQPASNTFGSGEWPHILYFPEEWTQNVSRTVTATNLSGQAVTLTLGFKFLQVRTN